MQGTYTKTKIKENMQKAKIYYTCINITKLYKPLEKKGIELQPSPCHRLKIPFHLSFQVHFPTAFQSCNKHQESSNAHDPEHGSKLLTHCMM